MEGYVVAGPDAKGIFSAHKLAEIVVEVLDEADKKALQVCQEKILLKLQNKSYILF